MGIPTNISDAVSAIRDGEFGTMDAMIGDIMVSALIGLSNPKDLMVTRKPVEEGYAITDAAVDVPRDITLTVVFANPEYSVDAALGAALSGNIAGFNDTWRDKRDQLYQLQEDREIITVQTHENLYENMIVSSISPIWDNEDNSDAWFADIAFQEITTVSTEAVGGLLDKAKEVVGGL